jgi:uncharacterized membrane protein
MWPKQNNFSQESTEDKIWATLTYLTAGILGFILLLLSKAQSRFLKFHIYQSILLSVLCLFGGQALGILFKLLGSLISLIPNLANGFILFQGLFFDALGVLLLALEVYCVITVWRNQYTLIKFVSDQIFKML